MGKGPGRSASARRGAAYLVAVAGAATVAAMLVGGALALRVQRAESVGLIEPGRARLAAASGLEVAAYRVMKNDGWRSGLGETWFSVSMGDATVRIDVTGPGGGALDDAEPATLWATAVSGASTQVLAAETTLFEEWPDALDNAVMAGSTLRLTASLTVDAMSACNDTARVLWARLYGDLETNTVVGNNVSGSLTTGITHDMPDPAALVDAYIAIGTPIPYSAIPSGTISKKLFSPSHNPFGGAVNAQGVYVIDCGGKDIKIGNTRILGTLVILDPGSGSTFGGSMLVAPALSGLASIVVRGNMTFNVNSSNTLSESALGTNFNPAGAPYADVSDADTADSYAPGFQGMLYATGSLSLEGTMTSTTPRGYTGAIMAGGTISVSGQTKVGWDSTLATDPPLGFVTIVERLEPTGIRREVAR
ncbi:MAG: hypothetical protein IT439_12825 [Phycisphaerales bacterium]|nr:hypothetical protein [Phycisphaerales bacterium]